MSRARSRRTFTPLAPGPLPDLLPAGFHRVDLPQFPVEVPPAPELMGVRHLGIAHLGCWIELPGQPTGQAALNEPTVLSQAGRLVGFRPGTFGATVPTRVLVLQQGSSQAALPFPVDARVLVAPRGWS